MAIIRAEVCVTHSEVVTSVVSDFRGSFSNSGIAMWLRSGLSCTLRYLVELYAPVSQTLRASVSHDSTRDADLLVSLLCMSFLLCSWRLLEAGCLCDKETDDYIYVMFLFFACMHCGNSNFIIMYNG